MENGVWMTNIKRTPVENQLRVYLKWCQNVKQVTDMTMASKRSILGKFIKETGINDISELTNKKIDWWIQGRATGRFGYKCNSTTINTNVATIVAWLAWLRDMDYRVKVKIRLVTKPKPLPARRKWYSVEDLEKVLDCCDELLDEVMIRVLFDTGLRASEFANLRISDISDRKIYVVGKSRKQAWVYISEKTQERLLTWIKTIGAIDYVWIKATRRQYYDPMTVDGIRKRLKKVFACAGFENFQLHELRHSFATDLRRRGAEVDVIQKLLRHSDLQVTQRYLHTLDGDLGSVWDGIKNYDLAPNCKAEYTLVRGEMMNIRT